MNRRTFLLVGALAFAVLAALPAAAKRNVRIGRLTEGGPPPDGYDAFRKALRTLGYGDVVIEARYARGQLDRLPALAAELARLGVDAIWATGSVATKAAMDATTSIPIVMSVMGADVGQGRFVDSLARPSGNVTGFSLIGSELAAKRLEFLRELVPGARHVAAIVPEASTSMPVVADWIRQNGSAAKTLGLGFTVRELPLDPEKWDRALGLLSVLDGTVLSVIESPFFVTERLRLGELLIKHRFPAIFPFEPNAEAGGLMSYGIDFRHLQERLAWYVARILDGTRPGDLPVERPTRYRLTINAHTARVLGLTVPSSLLLRADRVIE